MSSTQHRTPEQWLDAAARASVEVRGQLLLVVDARLQIVASNAAADAAFRAGPSGLVGTHAADLMPTDKRVELTRQLVALLSGPGELDAKASAARSVVGRRLDGTPLNGFVRAHVLHGSFGRSVAVRITDLSSETAVQAEFDGHDTLAAGVVRDVSVGVVVQAANGRILTANRAAEQMLGLGHRELVGLTSLEAAWESVHVDGTAFPGHERAAARTLHTGLPERDAIGVMHRDGTLGWFDVTATPLGSRPFPAVLLSFTEFTATRDAERVSALARRRLETLSSLSSEAQIVVDRSLRVVSTSPYAGRVLCCEPEHLIGRALLDLVAAPDRASFAVELARVLDVPGARFERDVLLAVECRQDVTFACRLMNLCQDAAIGGILINLRDIHEQRTAEAALRTANAELARRVAQLDRERTIDSTFARVAELLRACATRAEAHDALWGSLEQLFGDCETTLYLSDEGGAEMACHRCDGDVSTLHPSRCWALRTRRTHVSASGAPFRCEHLDPDPGAAAACVPVVVGGAIAALIVVTPGSAGRALAAAEDLDRLAHRLGAMLADAPLFHAQRRGAEGGWSGG